MVVISLSIFYYFSTKQKDSHTEDMNVFLNNIINDPDEYLSHKYFDALTIDEKQQLYLLSNELFDDNCKEGKLNERCSLSFLYKYISIRGWCFDTNLPLDKKPILDKLYLEIERNYDNLTESDLGGFLVPTVTAFCRNALNNLTIDYRTLKEQQNKRLMELESGIKMYDTVESEMYNNQRFMWFHRFTNVNKTTWDSTELQIYYIRQCMMINTISFLKEYVGNRMTLEEANSVCNILPTMEDINLKDLCQISDVINVKNFCEIEITQKDINVVRDAISEGNDGICKRELIFLNNNNFMTFVSVL